MNVNDNLSVRIDGDNDLEIELPLDSIYLTKEEALKLVEFINKSYGIES